MGGFPPIKFKKFAEKLRYFRFFLCLEDITFIHLANHVPSLSDDTSIWHR